MKNKIKVGSDFSGVGAFNQALIRLGIEYDELFACDMDKYARQTFELNYGTPKDFPKDVYEREIPKESLDIYMTSPPCQAFSLAGKRKGEDDKRGILFYNSHEFIVKNKPRYFIIENVKGLLSDDSGKTFQRWIDYLAGKSVNGNPVIFPHEEAAPYHVYYQVLNAKHYGVPQNRERIFIIGIRDDSDNTFSFPKPFPLEKRLKDVLESEVDEKYFLSDKMFSWLNKHSEKKQAQGCGFKFEPTDGNEKASCLTKCTGKNQIDENYIIHNTMPCSSKTGKGGTGPLSRSDGKTYCLDTGNTNAVEIVGAIKFGRTDEAKALRKENMQKGKDSTPFQMKQISGIDYEKMGTLTTMAQKDNLVQIGNIYDNEHNSVAGRVYTEDGKSVTLSALGGGGGAKTGLYQINKSIRRLTPRECGRLQTVPEDKLEMLLAAGISDSQLYKMFGNGWCIDVIVHILSFYNKQF
jgi:DNA (cytosine-5)-methyltransferase 1